MSDSAYRKLHVCKRRGNMRQVIFSDQYLPFKQSAVTNVIHGNTRIILKKLFSIQLWLNSPKSSPRCWVGFQFYWKASLLESGNQLFSFHFG